MGTRNTLSKLDQKEIMNCMQCGFCLPACPTYRETGKESASPRGRIALMKGVATGLLSIDDEFESNMNLCLGCRACETACPAGVRYGSLIEQAREVVADENKRKRRPSILKHIVFKELFPHPRRMQVMGTLLWAAQRTGLQTAARKSGLMRLLPKPLREMERVVDPVASPFERRQRVMRVPAVGEKKYTVGMFTGCVMDVMFYRTNQATARLLSKAGCEVVFVEGQVCCGALHAHSGEKEGAVELARKNIEAFEAAGVDVVINNAGGCGAALKEYHHWFADGEWKRRAMEFVRRMRDVNEFLWEIAAELKFREMAGRVTYQDSCHLAHGQGVRMQPRQLLKMIPGLTYVEMPEADRCCGSAGIYNIVQHDMSMQVLDDKMKNVKSTQASTVVTSNPGCLLQMKLGIERHGLSDRMRAVHIVDLLTEALE
jgi:glycolate oxidase iron-sulfur subunit